MAAGLVLRLVDLGRESFWLDEAGRAAVAARPPGVIASAVGVIELSPPLYHLLLHAWMGLAGDSDLAVRLLSALLGAAAIPLSYSLARTLLDRRTALVATVLAAVAPLYVVYSREAAMYALFLLLALLAALGHVGWLRGARWGLWLYAGAMLLALYTHYYTLFLLAAQNAHVLWLARRGELPAAGGRVWLLTQGALALAFLPWVPTLWQQARLAASVGDWAAPDPLAALGSLVLAFSIGPAVELPAVLVVLVALPALWAGLRAARRRPGLLAVLGCYLLVPVALGLLAAYPLHAFRERGFIAVAWVPQLLLAAGLVALATSQGTARASSSLSKQLARFGFPIRRPEGRASGPRSALQGGGRASAVARPAFAVHLYAVALLALLLYGTAAAINDPREQWRDAAALVAARAQAGDVLFVQHYGSQLALDRYLPPDLPRRGLPDDFDWTTGYTARYWLEPTDLDRRVAPELARARRVWLVLSHADGRGDRLLLDYFDARYPSVWSPDLYGIRLRLWQIRPDE